MHKLGATSLRVKARNMLDPRDAEAVVAWNRAGRTYLARCNRWAEPVDNLRAIERALYFLRRALQEYGDMLTGAQVGPNAAAGNAAFRQLFAGFEVAPDDVELMPDDGLPAWWEVLGVKPDARRPDVVSAYRTLARRCHPDVGGDTEAFKRVRRAYEQGLDARS
jgi:DnaJ domain